ncbi:MAG: hypothetical protein P1U42_05715 [Phycisphaerales bacterium]|nr:hypothetical protein [Phycisphaerales bacterium]
MSACTYERVVSRSSILSGIEGAESNIPEKKAARPLPDFLRTPDEGIRVVDEDGSVTLYAKSIRQLMAQIITTLQNGERELFVEQVLSQRTKDEFYERGLDPGLAFDELLKHYRDIGRLFYFMPMGEYTPGLYLETVGKNTFRLKISRIRNESLYWIGIDTVFEGNNYRLRWFVP